MGIGSFFSDSWKWVSGNVREVYTDAKDIIVDISDKIQDSFKDGYEVTKGVIVSGAEYVGAGLSTGVGAVKTVYSDVVGVVNKGLDTFSSPLIWATLGLGGIIILSNKIK